jgi:hypothetical protein
VIELVRALLALLVLLAACAPVQGRPAYVYRASKVQLADAIMQLGINTRAPGMNRNFNVVAVSDDGVTLRAQAGAVLTFSSSFSSPGLFVGTSSSSPSLIEMNWSFADRGKGTVLVAVSTRGLADPEELENTFFNALNLKFARVQSK